MHNETKIGKLIKSGDEQRAADMLIALLRKHGGNMVHAARACRVHHATFKRWVSRLAANGWDIREHLATIREEKRQVDQARKKPKTDRG